MYHRNTVRKTVSNRVRSKTHQQGMNSLRTAPTMNSSCAPGNNIVNGFHSSEGTEDEIPREEVRDRKLVDTRLSDSVEVGNSMMRTMLVNMEERIIQKLSQNDDRI